MVNTKISYSSPLADPPLTLKAIATFVHKSICPEEAENGCGMGAAASRHNTLPCRRRNGESEKGELLSQRAFCTAKKLAGGVAAPGPGPGGTPGLEPTPAEAMGECDSADGKGIPCPHVALSPSILPT